MAAARYGVEGNVPKGVMRSLSLRGLHTGFDLHKFLASASTYVGKEGPSGLELADSLLLHWYVSPSPHTTKCTCGNPNLSVIGSEGKALGGHQVLR